MIDRLIMQLQTLTVTSFANFGSWTNDAPFPQPGGASPVVMYFNDSIIVWKSKINTIRKYQYQNLVSK